LRSERNREDFDKFFIEKSPEFAAHRGTTIEVTEHVYGIKTKEAST